MNTPVFHRYAQDYLSVDEWGALLQSDQRTARVLGKEPLPDARHLLLPITTPEFASDDANPQRSAADFVVELRAERVNTVEEIAGYFGTATRVELDFPRVLVTIPSRGMAGERSVLMDESPPNARVLGVILVWSLPDLLSIGDEQAAVADLRRFVSTVAQIGVQLGMTSTATSDPTESARNAVRLRALLLNIGSRNELRLYPFSGSFASRDVWRAVYSLGLEWGNLDLFHWMSRAMSTEGKPIAPVSLFRVLSSGTPAYFLPERAIEGERVPGLILEYDLPHASDPVAVFDRMAVALSYLRSVLGGRPVNRQGIELDAEQLDSERDSLADAIRIMTAAGIAPGSEAARRFF